MKNAIFSYLSSSISLKVFLNLYIPSLTLHIFNIDGSFQNCSHNNMNIQLKWEDDRANLKHTP